MTTFLGKPLLDVVPHRPDQKEQWEQSSRVMENRAGAIGVTYDRPYPIIQREFPWFLEGWDEIQAMLTFLDTIRGSYSAFYMPTWRDDFVPTSLVFGTYDAWPMLTFQAFGFPDLFRRLRRKEVAFINGSSVDARPLFEVGDNGDGTEYFVIGDGAPLAPTLNAQTMICLCPLVRLTSDQMDIEWRPHDAEAEVVLNVTEVIGEAGI